MNHALWYVVVVLMALIGAPRLVVAHGKGHGNLQVLKGLHKKKIDLGMKLFSKGIGIKCRVCHVQGKWSRDDKKTKASARRFLKVVLEQKDQSKLEEALDLLRQDLKLQKLKNRSMIKEALMLWSSKRSSQ